MKRRLPIAPALVGAGVAALLFALLPADNMPLELVSAFSGRTVTQVDVTGGAVFELRVRSDDPAVIRAVARNARDRCEAVGYRTSTRTRGTTVNLSILDVGPEAAPDVMRLLASAASLEFRIVVPNTAAMRAARGNRTVEWDVDLWVNTATGARVEDVYAWSPSADALARFAADTALEPGHELAFEWNPRAVRWRTYVVRSRVALDGSHIARASTTFNPATNRPEVLLEFDGAGATAFADLTEELVGHKLAIVSEGQVLSAPVIMGRIPGGRATIDMGASADAREAQLDAENLAAALNAGEMPAEVELGASAANPPNVSGAALTLSRLTFAVLFGLLLFGATAALQRALTPLAPIARAQAVAGAAPSHTRPWGRLAVTVAAPAVVIAAQHLSLPTLDPHVLDLLVGPGQQLRASVFALGLWPMLAGFVIAEIAALALPRWRGRRHDPAFRQRLAVAGAAIGIALALVQGWTAALTLDSLPFVELPSSFRPVTMLTFAAGTLALTVFASLVGRYGLGNGYSIVLTTTLVAHGRDTLSYMAESDPPPLVLCALVTGVGATVLSTVWILRARANGMRLPSGGLIPLAWSSAVVQLIALLAWMGLAVPFKWVSVLGPTTLPRFAALVVIVAALGAGCSWAMSRAHPLRAANVASTAYLVILIAVGFAVAHYAPEAWFDLVAVVIGTAVAIDVVDEWRARSRHPALAEACSEHRIQRVDSVVHALRDAGIPAYTRGAAHRALLHFFGPYVPVVIYVPRDRMSEAREILAD